MASSIHRVPRFRHRSGFTLIELLVVVVIIGILAATAMPNFVGAQDKARNVKALANLNTVRVALETYGAEHNGNFPDNAAFATNPGLGENLMGGKLPISPWASKPQTTRIQPAITPAVLIEDYTSNPSLRAPKAGSPHVPATNGVPANPPAAVNDFGGFLSDCDDNGDRTRYIVYVIGKKGKQAIVAGCINNFGI